MNYREQDSGVGAFAIGVIAGAVVGAGVALLLAPKSGTQLRGDIGESVGTVRDALGRRYSEMAARAGVEIDNLQERVEKATEAVEAGAREVIQAAGRARTHVGRG